MMNKQNDLRKKKMCAKNLRVWQKKSPNVVDIGRKIQYERKYSYNNCTALKKAPQIYLINENYLCKNFIEAVDKKIVDFETNSKFDNVFFSLLSLSFGTKSHKWLHTSFATFNLYF